VTAFAIEDDLDASTIKSRESLVVLAICAYDDVIHRRPQSNRQLRED